MFVRGVTFLLMLHNFTSAERLYLCGVLKNIVTSISKFVNFLLFAEGVCSYITSHFTRPKFDLKEFQ